MKLKLFMFFFIGYYLLSNEPVTAQLPSLFDIKNMYATSPDASILGRFGEIPVGKYTGTADVGIPIYTFEEAKLSVPVALKYHGSGIKVQDEASSVGLGWSLVGGGAIIQVINAKEDPLDNLPGWDLGAYNWLKGNVTAGAFQMLDANEWQCGLGMTAGYTTALFAGLKTGHGQPDIFIFSFPGGYDGKFYINPENGQIVQLDKKEEIKFAGGPTGWTATTEDGHIFQFNAIETSFWGETTGRTFRLTKIIFNNGKEMNFEYYDGSYYSYSYNERIHKNFLLAIDNPGEVISGTLVTPNHTTKTLRRISMDDMAIEFNLEDREDLFGSSDTDGDNSNGILSTKRIKSIDIRNGERLLKKFKLNYDYFPYTTIGSGAFMYDPMTTPVATVDKIGKRLRLLSVQEVGYLANNSSMENPPYQFEYDPTTLPLKTSFARDFWGYYNGKNNQKILPDLSFFYFSGYPEYAGMPVSLLEVKGANRMANVVTNQAGMLKKVTFPTGGSSVFEYESNDFTNYTYPDQDLLNAAERPVTVKDQNNTTDVYSTQFTLNRTQTIRFTVSIQKGPPFNTVTFNQLLPSTVTLTKILNIGMPNFSATNLKTWQMLNNIDYQNDFNADGMVQWIEDITLPYEANATYVVTCDMPSAIPPQNTSTAQAGVMAQFKYYDLPAGGFQFSKGGGLRVKSVTNYSAPGVFASKKGYRYVGENNLSSGILMTPLKHLYASQSFFLAATAASASGMCANYNWGESTVWYMSSESMIPFSTGAKGLPVGYSRVEEMDLNASNIPNGKNVYTYFNTESESHPNAPESPDLRNGQMLSEVVKNAQDITLGEITYTYEDLATANFNGLKLIPKFFGHRPCDYYAVMGITPSPGDACLPPEYANNMKEWAVLFYPIKSSWYKVKTRTSKTFDGQSPFSQTEQYTYDAKGFLVQTDISNSKQQQSSTQNVYPTTATPGLSTPTELMAYANRYNTLLEQKVLLNGVEQSKVKFNYGVVPGQPKFRLLNVERSYNGAALTEDVNYWSETAFERIQQTDERGRNAAIIWSDYYSDPIAKIQNLSGDVTAHAAYTSFESNQTLNKGGWSYTGTSTYDPTSPSGTKLYRFGNGNTPISKTGLNPAYIYIITYWTKNASSFPISGTVSGYPVLRRTINGWRLYEHRITGQTQVSIGGNGFIDELRLYTVNARMVTMNYEKGVGMVTKMETDNTATYYNYDHFGRLFLIRDQERKILKKICYNYFGQSESGCTVDLTPQWVETGGFRCQACSGAPDSKSNVLELEIVDVNPYSAQGYQWKVVGVSTQCPYTCPPPCDAGNCTGDNKKCVNGVCETGVLICVSSVRQGLSYTCTWRYCFSDGSLSTYSTTTTASKPCAVVTCP